MDSTLTVSTLAGVLSAPLSRDVGFLPILAEKKTDATMLCRQPFDFVHVRACERARIRVRDTSEAVFTSILLDNTGRQSRISADIGRG